jgi:hypothetical protein
MPTRGDVFKSGDRREPRDLPVIHDPAHDEPHEVTVLYGKRFPRCQRCEHARFLLVRGAENVETHGHFKGDLRFRVAC